VHGRRGEREISLELARTQKLEFGHERKRGENVVCGGGQEIIIVLLGREKGS
jgi:hypothetical protein